MGKAAAEYQPDEQWDRHEHEACQRDPEGGPGSRVGAAFDRGGHGSIISCSWTRGTRRSRRMVCHGATRKEIRAIALVLDHG